MIGMEFTYPKRRKRFKLKEISETGIYFFECGHWCTDNVFKDLKMVKPQLQLFSSTSTNETNQ